MRLIISLKVHDLIVPVSSNSILQGFLYHCLGKNPEYSEFLHDSGYSFEQGRRFKAFTFCGLSGKYEYDREKQQLLFHDRAEFQVSSPDLRFCNILIKALYRTDSLELNHQQVSAADIWVEDAHIFEDVIDVRMLSPIVVHKKLENGFTKFYAPWDPEWELVLQENFERKYPAITGAPAQYPVRISPVKVGDRDKIVTKFKGQYYMTGYKGTYQLRGPAPYLDFLYQTGLGANTSQGFGMFEYR